MSDNPKTDKAMAQIADVEVRKQRSKEELLARAAELLRKVPIDGEAEEVEPERATGRSVVRR